MQWLGGTYESLGPRFDAHRPVAAGALLDCAHFCYSPFLWDPVLDAFYHAVRHWSVDTADDVHDASL